MVSQLSDADDQGGMLGLASSLASLGRVVGPAWGGYLYDALRHDHAVPERGGADVRSRLRVSFTGLRSEMTPRFLHAGNPGPLTGDGNWTYLIDGDRPVLIDAGVGTPSHLDAIDAAAGARRPASRGDPRAQRSHRRRAGDRGAAAVDACCRRCRGRSAIAIWRGRRWPTATSIETGEGPLQVVHTPGHAPDHLCLWHAESRTLFVGDMLRAGHHRGDSCVTRRQPRGVPAPRSIACCALNPRTRAARARTGDRGSAGADSSLRRASRRARAAGAGGARLRRRHRERHPGAHLSGPPARPRGRLHARACSRT